MMQDEIDRMFDDLVKRQVNSIVEQALAEGNEMTSIAKEAIENIYGLENPANDPVNFLPTACESCPNHPKNGGSGICLCTIGVPKITC